MKRKSKWKKILIGVIAAVLVVAGGLGAWYYFAQGTGEPVNVYQFSYIGMTEYWGDSQESYGPVNTDKIQTIYLSDTQTVTSIAVSPGDTVHKGDLLMTFDTTLSDLALERKRLDVEKLKLQLQDAQKELVNINSMKPMVIPTPSVDDEEEEENLGTALSGAYMISTQKAYDGSSGDKALICWISGTTDIDGSLLEAIRLKAEEYQEFNALAALPPTETTPPAETVTPEETAAPSPTEAPAEPTEAPEEPDLSLTVDRFYVVFKVTEGNMSLGQTSVWQGVEVVRDPDTNSYSFRFYDASGVTDHMIPQSDTPEIQEPEVDYGSGYTSAQIAQMRSEQEKLIRDLQFQIKMAEADYKIMQTEVNDGKIYAEIDGEVVSMLSEEEAKMTMQPILKVSGGGGFYVEGTVSELEKENLQLGQEVTINDWNTGMTYTGTIESMGNFPSAEGYWNGMGNPNTSYYPFTVFIDGSADLQAGSYVSVMYSAGSAEQGIYLENPFLRTEQGKSYVYLRGEDGKLEKRFVTTGKSLWGSYTEILDGITPEDQIAFPYGKNVKQGAETKESDLSELYNY